MKNYYLDPNGYYAEVNESTKNVILAKFDNISKSECYKSKSKNNLPWTINLNKSNELLVSNFLKTCGFLN